ncbi:hypothetical protein G7Z17_g8027 [Cylindrodendrum hubeiense]|uniref:Flavin-containing monooxygenase n=1 Tax=Cylindrodendrum hubeiense TaxID=595255 RepID=A0A9P5HC14_9HYPO|nr:hypothetical protein G7Z17_g8027 [Cylindrodendrum hubeiense]
MAPRYKRIAVIGAGPSGLAAVKALESERIFDYVRVFERQDRVGGLWAYDAEPDRFQTTSDEAEKTSEIPEHLRRNGPCFTSPAPEKLGQRGSAYDTLDTNAGARTMAFTHAPLPFGNSIQSIRKYGRNNSSRPRHVVLKYLEDLFEPYFHLLQLNTSVERVEKNPDGEWVLTLRQQSVKYGTEGATRDYWWQEAFDAVIVASGHFTVASVPEIDGLKETFAKLPEKFEHSKAWRSQQDYVGKRVLVVGGGVSAADLADDLHDIVEDSLYVSQRTEVEFLKKAFSLPNVVKKPPIKSFSHETNGTVHFVDGTFVSGLDKIIFATGYKLSYPYLPFKAVTPYNRLAGFYQHIFRIGDPSLVVIGQVRAAISFRIYEYQAVAVGRYFAGRTEELPDQDSQKAWEKTRLEYKGHTELFHEIKPDFVEYYGWLTDFSGAPAEGTDAYTLPIFEDDWVKSDIEILLAKDKYWDSLIKHYQGVESLQKDKGPH